MTSNAYLTRGFDSLRGPALVFGPNQAHGLCVQDCGRYVWVNNVLGTPNEALSWETDGSIILKAFLLGTPDGTLYAHVVTSPPYSATGGGTVDDRAALAAAETAAGSSSTLFFPKGTYKVSSDLTITAAVIFANGAQLSPDTGVTITLRGPILAGRHQIFTNATAGLGTIKFTQNSFLTEIYPEWWGANGNAGYASTLGAATDSSAAFQATIAAATIATADLNAAAVQAGQASPYVRKIRCNAGAMYRLTTSVTFQNIRGMWFDGNGCWFTWDGNASTPMFNVRGCSYCKWSDFSVSSNLRQPLFAVFLVRKFDADSVQMTEPTWEKVEIQGNAGSVGYGWLIGAGDTSGNNEFGRWESCRATNYADAAIAITSGINSKAHLMHRCGFAGDNFGLRGVTTYAKHHHVGIFAIGRSNLTASGGATTAFDTKDFKYGAGGSTVGSVAITIPGATTGVVATGSLGLQSPHLPLTCFTHAVMWVKTAVALTSGDYQVILRDSANATLATLDIPTIGADCWTFAKMALPATPPTGVASIAVNIAVDKGANTLKLQHLRARRGSFDGIAATAETAAASFHWKNGWMGNHLITDFEIAQVTDTITIEGVDSENTPRQVVVASLQDNLSITANTHPLSGNPIKISGYRANSVNGSFAHDGDTMIFDTTGPVEISNSSFRMENAVQRFRIYGGAASTGASTTDEDSGLLTLHDVQFRDMIIPTLPIRYRVGLMHTNAFPRFAGQVQIDAADAGWVTEQGANVTVTHPTAPAREGKAVVSLNVAAGATTGNLASKTLAAVLNLTGARELWTWIFGAVVYNTCDLQVVLECSNGTTVATLNVPKWQKSANANWARMRMTLPQSGLQCVAKIYLRAAVDRGADANLRLDDIISTDLGDVLIESCDGAFSSTNASVTQTNDAGDRKQGTASLRLRSTGANVTGDWATQNFLEPFNLVQKDRIAFWIKSTNAFTNARIRIRLQNPGGTNVADMQVPALVADTWTRVAFDSTNSNLTDVKRIIVHVVGGTTSAANTEIWLDEVRATNGPDFFTRRHIVAYSNMASPQSNPSEPSVENLFDVNGTITRVGIGGYNTAVAVQENRAGRLVVSGTDTCGTFTFPVTEPDTSYFVNITPVQLGGAPAAGSTRVQSVTKQTCGVTVIVEAAPGAGTCVVFDVITQRGNTQ